MAQICPSVTPTTSSNDEYREMMDKVVGFASRVQIDLMDGEFAKPKTLDLGDVWWPESVTADIHLMYKRPVEYMETMTRLGPNMVIMHAEAEGSLVELIRYLQGAGIKAGVALLQQTSVESAKSLIEIADHVLIFSGTLGSYGGTADLALLEKASQAKQINPSIEVGWDGGANLENVRDLSVGGVDVINVGGAIHKALSPKDVYANMVKRVSTA